LAGRILRYGAGSVQRFLLIQLKRLGDLILTAPAVAALREALPQAEIVMLTTKSAAELARCIRGVDRVIHYRSGGVNLEAWSSAIMGPWTGCLDFTGTDRSALLTSLTKAKERIGYEKFAGNRLRRRACTHLCRASVRDQHTVDFHVALVNELSAVHAAQAHPHRPRGGAHSFLVIPESAQSDMQKRLTDAGITRSYAVVHPGTAREEKSWQPEKWAEIIQKAQSELGLPVILTGSGDGWEKRHIDDIKHRLKVPVTDFTHQLSLVELAALIEGCSLMVGVDSMAMHLAAIFERPQVGLFGPTNPFHWRPRHDRGSVVTSASPLPLNEFSPRMSKGEVKHISTDTVLGAMRTVVSQS
jgi:ADP-heptose:LPS heptosyltransferase